MNDDLAAILIGSKPGYCTTAGNTSVTVKAVTDEELSEDFREECRALGIYPKMGRLTLVAIDYARDNGPYVLAHCECGKFLWRRARLLRYGFIKVKGKRELACRKTCHGKRD